MTLPVLFGAYVSLPAGSTVGDRRPSDLGSSWQEALGQAQRAAASSSAVRTPFDGIAQQPGASAGTLRPLAQPLAPVAPMTFSGAGEPGAPAQTRGGDLAATRDDASRPDASADVVAMRDGGEAPSIDRPIDGKAVGESMSSATEAFALSVAADAGRALASTAPRLAFTDVPSTPSALNALIGIATPPGSTALRSVDNRSSVATLRPEPALAEAPSAPPPDLHVHVEWSPQGLSLWLGAGANQALPLDSLVHQLRRWLADRGERLRALVCNGQTVFSEADTPSRIASHPDLQEPS